MSITSGQITARLRQEANPAARKQELMNKVRYLVAQEPAANDFTDTVEGYYKGRKVYNGPMCNKRIGPPLTVQDIHTLETEYFIRFVDNATTPNADESIVRALITIMDDSEADEYEAAVAKQLGVKLNAKRKAVNSPSAE